MKYGIFALKDKKVGFMNPFVQLNDEVAERTVKVGAMSDDAMTHNCPEDFELWKLGTYNSETGEIYAEPEFIKTVYEIVRGGAHQ